MTDYGWIDASPPTSTAYLLPATRHMLGDARRVLDVGCGNGAVTAMLAQLGYDVVGVDASLDGIEIARSAFRNIRFEHVAASEDMLEVLGEEPFDAVISLEVVEHVFDPHLWARACHNALTAEGLLVCSTPYHGYLKNAALALAGGFDEHWGPLRAGGHIKFWSRRTISQLLTESGFSVERFVGVGRLPYLWKSMVVGARPHISP